MQSPIQQPPGLARYLPCVVLSLAAAAPIASQAQTPKPAEKTVVVEPGPAASQPAPANSPFTVFAQWLQQVTAPAPAAQVSLPVVVQPFLASSAAPGSFEAPAVILGQPELPLATGA